MKISEEELELHRQGDRFVASLWDRADAWNGPYPLWHGWAIREAYVAGAKSTSEKGEVK